MDSREARSVQAIVTDPPYGLKEYTDIEQRKLRNGRGGVWRIPPSFDGCKRNPDPRFTVLAGNERGTVFVLRGSREASYARARPGRTYFHRYQSAAFSSRLCAIY